MSAELEILVAKEAARVLRLSVQRIYELCRTDKSFPKIVCGRRQYRFSKTALLRYIEAGGSTKEEK